MKIKYDNQKNYWKCHDETLGIYLMKKKLLKNPQSKIHGSIYWTLYYVGIVLMILLMNCYFYCFDKKSFSAFINFFNVIMILIIALILVQLISIFVLYFKNKKRGNGVLKINKEGLTDVMDIGRTYICPWDKVLFVAIKKYTVTFILDDRVLIFVEIKHKKDILEALQTYQRDLLVIDQSGEF